MVMLANPMEGKGPSRGPGATLTGLSPQGLSAFLGYFSSLLGKDLLVLF